MLEDTDDVFDSVTWETPSSNVRPYDVDTQDVFNDAPPGYRQSNAAESETGRGPHEPKWEGFLLPKVKDGVKELGETKDAYVSYNVTAETNLPIFSSSRTSVRRRFQDFVFLRNNLVRDFPASVVPPLPDKHRSEYITGDRFSTEFIERRRVDLEQFLTRLARHPTLQRSTLVRAFFESTEWTVQMHQHVAHPAVEPSHGLLENLQDTWLNAFSRLKKADERFVVMRDDVEKFEEGLQNIERVWSRLRTRNNDLTNDYHDLAVAVQGLGFLESGITDPLNHFSNTLLEFSAAMRHATTSSTDPFLLEIQSMLRYSQAHRAVLKLRDQKQLDTEELSGYLTSHVDTRDRLAAIVSGRAGSTGLGLGAYFRDQVDRLRGADDDRTRMERIRKLDGKIKELQDAVTNAHETSDAFNDETLREQKIFQHVKRAEFKENLGNLADGQIEMYRAAMEEWDRIIPRLQRINVTI